MSDWVKRGICGYVQVKAFLTKIIILTSLALISVAPDWVYLAIITFDLFVEYMLIYCVFKLIEFCLILLFDAFFT